MLIAFVVGIKNPRTEYAKAYDAGRFGHRMLGILDFNRSDLQFATIMTNIIS